METDMKKLLLILAAAGTLAAVPASAAPNRDHHNRTTLQQNWNGAGHNNRKPVKVVNRNQGHRWARGQHFDRRYATNYQVVSNYKAYRLQAPPRGYRYVRSNNDIVMVAIASGLIGAVFANAF
jgi:Ni/Co efflux regulator RcnB